MLFIDGESKMDLSEYVQSPEWLVILIHVSLLSIKFYLRNIIEAPGYKNIKLFDNKNITIMTYNLILRRNGGFISYILIVPCILMAILTMVVFWLPPETPSKLILGMNVFGAFFFLLLILADFVPTASNKIPMIGKKLLSNIQN
jgi:hypothetical protein